MKLSFKSGFILGFIAALIIIPIGIVLGGNIKNYIQNQEARN